MRTHAESRLNLIAQITKRVGWRMVGVNGVSTHERWHASHTGADRHQLGLCLSDIEVTTFRVFDVKS